MKALGASRLEADGPFFYVKWPLSWDSYLTKQTVAFCELSQLGPLRGQFRFLT